MQAGVEVGILKTVDAAATTAINLTGNTVAQTLIGNTGANRLNGGSGNDTITGGVGADVFVFTTALASNIDRLTDYAVAADRFELNDAAFTGLARGALATAAFAANLAGAATNGLQRIIYETDTGFLWFDADGSGIGSATVQFADLAGGLAILASEFSII